MIRAQDLPRLQVDDLDLPDLMVHEVHQCDDRRRVERICRLQVCAEVHRRRTIVRLDHRRRRSGRGGCKVTVLDHLRDLHAGEETLDLVATRSHLLPILISLSPRRRRRSVKLDVASGNGNIARPKNVNQPTESLT
jgi:hypothetical protein